MTITATAHSDGAPPYVDVQMSIAAGAVMQSVTLWRTADGVRELVRTQPTAGLDTALVTDYEAPYEVPLVYSWETEFVDPSAIETVWSEQWADLSAWTVTGAGWSVSGGALIWSGADDPTAEVSRDVAPGEYQVAFDAVPVGIGSIDFGGFHVDVANSLLVVGDASVSFDPGDAGWTVGVVSSVVTLTTSVGSYQLAGSVEISQVAFVGAIASLVEDPTAGFDTTANAGYVNAIGTDGSNWFVPYDSHAGGETVHIDVIDIATGALVTSFGSPGTGDGQFMSIRAILVDGTDVFVAEHSRVQKFVPSGGTWVYDSQFGTPGTGQVQFNGIRDMALYVGAYLLICDTGNNRVQFINKTTYAYVTAIDTVGTTPGALSNPFAVAALGSSNVLVADSAAGHGRVQVFDGITYERLFAPEGVEVGELYDIPFGQSLAVDDEDNVYVISRQGAGFAPFRVTKFDSTGNVLLSVSDIASGGDAQDAGSAAIVTTGDLVAIRRPSANDVVVYDTTRARIEGVTLSEYAGLTFLTEEADPVELTPDNGWLIHPGEPALSFPLSRLGYTAAGLRSIEPVVNRTNTTIHRILGSPTPVTSTTGVRSDDETTLTITTFTNDERLALRGLLAPDFPILIQFPPSWEVEFNGGFYDVGDLETDRVAQRSVPYRVFRLPLTKVQPPITDVQTFGWSYAAVASEFDTYADLLPVFTNYAALSANARS